MLKVRLPNIPWGKTPIDEEHTAEKRKTQHSIPAYAPFDDTQKHRLSQHGPLPLRIVALQKKPNDLANIMYSFNSTGSTISSVDPDENETTTTNTPLWKDHVRSGELKSCKQDFRGIEERTADDANLTPRPNYERIHEFRLFKRMTLMQRQVE